MRGYDRLYLVGYTSCHIGGITARRNDLCTAPSDRTNGRVASSGRRETRLKEASRPLSRRRGAAGCSTVYSRLRRETTKLKGCTSPLHPMSLIVIPHHPVQPTQSILAHRTLDIAKQTNREGPQRRYGAMRRGINRRFRRGSRCDLHVDHTPSRQSLAVKKDRCMHELNDNQSGTI